MGADKEDFPGLNNWMDGGTVLCSAEGWERAVTFLSVPLAPARGCYRDWAGLMLTYLWFVSQ